MGTEVIESQNIYTGRPVIRTTHGWFDLNRPEFDIYDIAHSLAMNCRYNGHTEWFYSVAEHSVLVARIMALCKLGDPREGLLHDATEAYLTDVPAPFKYLLPDWLAIDDRLDSSMRTKFGIGPKTAGCKTADWLALFIEANSLITGGGADFLDPNCLRPWALELGNQHSYLRVAGWSPEEGEEKFIDACYTYGILKEKAYVQ